MGTKITALTENSTLVFGDILPVVDDPSGSPVTQKVTVANLFKVISDGWLDPGETWTFATATTFTVPGNVTGTYTVGTKLKLTQTTAKYFYVQSAVYSAPNTTVTVVNQNNYTLANAAITSPFYSRAEVPVGFPDWFAYGVVFVGFSADPTIVVRYKISGRMCAVFFTMPVAGTSNTTGFTISLPLAAATVASMEWWGVLGLTLDNGAYVAAGSWRVSSAGTTATLFTSGAGGWTASGTKRADGSLMYEI